LLARCGDIDDLTRGLLRLVRDPELRGRLAAHGHARALAEFDWDAKLQLVRDTYEAQGKKKKGRE
jgi:glycosyltransferase involved in cell wall biosynthesis